MTHTNTPATGQISFKRCGPEGKLYPVYRHSMSEPWLRCDQHALNKTSLLHTPGFGVWNLFREQGYTVIKVEEPC